MLRVRLQQLSTELSFYKLRAGQNITLHAWPAVVNFDILISVPLGSFGSISRSPVKLTVTCVTNNESNIQL